MALLWRGPQGFWEVKACGLLALYWKSCISMLHLYFCYRVSSGSHYSWFAALMAHQRVVAAMEWGYWHVIPRQDMGIVRGVSLISFLHYPLQLKLI
jgi:hypothetical protein